MDDGSTLILCYVMLCYVKLMRVLLVSDYDDISRNAVGIDLYPTSASVRRRELNSYSVLISSLINKFK